MKVVGSIAFLTLIHLVCSVVVLQSSTTSTAILAPAASKPILSAYFNKQENDIAGAGVDWIQSSKPAIGKIIYQSLFYTNCIGASYILITAAQSFTAYLDDKIVISGYNFATIHKANLQLDCGNHNLTVVVTTNTTLSGLTFSINQDQSKCFNCQANAFWSQLSCKCECLNRKGDCLCSKPKIWKDYPTCACGCPTPTIKKRLLAIDPPTPPSSSRPDLKSSVPQSSSLQTAQQPSALRSVAQQSQAKQSLIFCPAPRYYSQQICECVCPYRYCGYKEQFNPTKCQCDQLIY